MKKEMKKRRRHMYTMYITTPLQDRLECSFSIEMRPVLLPLKIRWYLQNERKKRRRKIPWKTTTTLGC
jgi:hypothetical protein